jgi:hypothetical protein
MSPRFWLDQLPSTDPSFAPLQLAEQLSEPADWPILAQAHRQARSDAAWGRSLDVLEAQSAELLHVAARLKERDDDGSDAAAVHRADLEALGYALGLTSVRVAIRAHDAETAKPVAA